MCTAAGQRASELGGSAASDSRALVGSVFTGLRFYHGIAVNIDEGLRKTSGFAGLYVDTDEIPVTAQQRNAAICMANLKATLQVEFAVALGEPGSYDQWIANATRDEVVIVCLLDGYPAIQMLIVLHGQAKRFRVVPSALFAPHNVTGIVDVPHAVYVVRRGLQMSCKGSGQIPQKF